MSKFKPNFSLLILLIAAMMVSCSEKPSRTVFRNGTIYTMDESQPTAEILICEDDEIIFVGSQKDAEKYAGGDAEVIDLEGAVVLPGLIDAHAHLLSYGKSLNEIQLRGMDSPESIRNLVLEKTAETESGEWITGRGWDQTKWQIKEFPTWKHLSGAESNPVFLKRVDGHAVWVNRTALNICGISANTPNPPGGEIIRFPNGEPTGVLLDNAIDLVKDSIPPTSPEQNRRYLLEAMPELNRLGITGVGDAWINRDALELYRDMAKAGELTIRIYGMIDGEEDFLSIIPRPLINYADGMLTVRAVKLFADGALGSRGALFFEPYSDRPETQGLLVTAEDDIFNKTTLALKNGFQVATHAIGDRANHNVLNAYERALGKVPTPAHRLRVEHCQILHPNDIPRFAELGVIASMQPTHATSDMLWAEKRVGPRRIKGGYAWRTLKETGAKLAFGSDFPVEEPNPFYGIYAAITRMDKEGNPKGGWFPEQCLTLEEALRGFTIDAAYAQFMEEYIGALKPGMKADLIIIDRDIFNISPSEILYTQVLRTVLNGKIIYKRADN